MAAQDFQTLRRGLQAPERPGVVSSAQSHLRLQAPEHLLTTGLSAVRTSSHE